MSDELDSVTEPLEKWQRRFDDLASGVVPFSDGRIRLLRQAVRDGVTKLGNGGAEAIAALFGQVEQARADAMIAYELRQRLIEHRNALQAKLAALGVGADDVDVRAHKERVDGEVCRAEEMQLRWCEARLASALGLHEHDGWDALIASVAALKDEQCST